MANLLKGRKASHKSSYEGFDLSHNVYFTSSVGHVLPIHWDFLLPGDKVDIKTHMVTRLQPMNSASPITLREHVDYYFVPLECLYSLFPSLLSDTNEDASSSLFESSSFSDSIPMANINDVKNTISALTVETDEDRWEYDAFSRGASRLIEFFRLGTIIKSETIPVAKRVMCNTLLLQAYQAVYQYFFRNDQREQFAPERFNIDQFYNAGGVIASSAAKNFFEIYYRPWKKDPYTIVSPSPLGGQSSLNHFSNSGDDNNFNSFVKQWLLNTQVQGEDFIRNNPDVRNGLYGGNLQQPYTDISFPASTYGFNDADVAQFNNPDTPSGTNVKIQQSLQQHRIAQAIEKLSSIWMQSGKNYKDFMSNMFGVHVKEDWSKPMYIGSDTNNITINEEVANVTTGAGSDILTNAGEITGRGFGKTPGTGCKFTAERHGILLALYSCVPDAIYGNRTIDVFNTYSKRNSFPNPVTDELGEQPLFGFEYLEADDTLDTELYGWLPRFHELKLKESRAYGDFLDTLSFWLPYRDASNSSYYPDQWKFFYINPDYLNNIMLQGYSRERDLEHMFANDPMMHFFRVEESKGSKMSSFGVPKTYFG